MMVGLPSSPIFADLYLTHLCNLSCGFCYYRAFPDAGGQELSTAGWKSVIDELATMKVLRVSIPGGEPFMRGDILELLEHIARRRMQIRLNTNGTLLDESIADALKNIGHFHEIQISLDGLRERHDAIRGQGTWDRATHAVRLLKGRGLPVSVNMVMTEENHGDCEAACRHFCEELKVDSLRVTPVNDVWSPLGSSSHRLTLEHTAELVAILARLAREYPALARGGSAFLAYYRNIRNPRPSPATPCRCCRMLWQGITIRADGAIVCCPNGGDKVLGHVGADSILEVWRDSPIMADLRNRAKAGRTDLPPQCDGCEYGWYCRQNCVALPPHAVQVCLKEIKRLLSD